MENPDSPESDNSSSTPTDVFVEHNPLPESAEEPVSNHNGVAIMNNKAQPPREIRRTSSSRVTESNVLPQVDCQEKIVLCVDMSSEINNVPFRFGDGKLHLASDMMRRILEIFLHSKHRINQSTEFAVILLYDSATWFRDFTSSIDDIIDFLHNPNETNDLKTFNLTSIFEEINKHVTLPQYDGHSSPPFVVRTILLYGRSRCIPDLDRTKVYWQLRNSPYFFIDAFYIHEPLNDDNKCQEIFDILCDLDENGLSYVFEVTRNTTKLHNCMARLLAHPLQRPIQLAASYKISAPTGSPTQNDK